MTYFILFMTRNDMYVGEGDTNLYWKQMISPSYGKKILFDFSDVSHSIH